MKEYLGEEIIELKDLEEYKNYGRNDWALLWIFMYEGIDGAHHKQWLLDQVVRILKGTKVIVKRASWSNGHTELRFSLAEPTTEYYNWVADCKDGEDGPDTYSYDEGIAP